MCPQAWKARPDLRGALDRLAAVQLQEIGRDRCHQFGDPRIVHVGDQRDTLEPAAHVPGKRARLVRRDKAWRVGMKDQPAIDRARAHRRVDRAWAGDAANLHLNGHGLGCMGRPVPEIKQGEEPHLSVDNA